MKTNALICFAQSGLFSQETYTVCAEKGVNLSQPTIPHPRYRI